MNPHKTPTVERQTRKYLNQVRYLEQALAWKKQQIAALRQMTTNATAKLSDMPRSDSPNLQRLETLICKIADLEQEVQADYVALESTRIQLTLTILNLPNMLHQQLLTERYLQNRSWKEIAGILGYSTSHIFRLHDDALCDIQQLLAKGETTL